MPFRMACFRTSVRMVVARVANGLRAGNKQSELKRDVRRYIAEYMLTARSRLNGWQRLGIVLSGFWIICVGIEYWVEQVQGPFSFGWVTDTVNSETVSPPRENNALPHDPAADVWYNPSEKSAPRLSLQPVEQVVNMSRLLPVLFAPPILLWAIGCSVVWVRRGFRKPSKDA